MSEEWRPVVGFEGRYEVSSTGQVMSLPKPTRAWPIIMIPQISARGGYPSVALRDGSRRVVRPVHVLMLEAFVGPRPEGFFALHCDDDPMNCTISNLRWGSPSDNSRDAVRNGRHPQARKSHCKRGHELVDENLWVNSRGHRTCRACVAERKAAKR